MSDNSGLPKSIGAPATRALTAAGYLTLEQLAGVPRRDLEQLHGVGLSRAIRILDDALAERGLTLG
jgi:hypothetical protein